MPWMLHFNHSCLLRFSWRWNRAPRWKCLHLNNLLFWLVGPKTLLLNSASLFVPLTASPCNQFTGTLICLLLRKPHLLLSIALFLCLPLGLSLSTVNSDSPNIESYLQTCKWWTPFAGIHDHWTVHPCSSALCVYLCKHSCMCVGWWGGGEAWHVNMCGCVCASHAERFPFSLSYPLAFLSLCEINNLGLQRQREEREHSWEKMKESWARTFSMYCLSGWDAVQVLPFFFVVA